MKYRVLFSVSLLVVFASCFLFKDYRKSQFNYVTSGRAAFIPLVVPKGFIKQERVDTAGISLQTYYYPGGAILYAAFLADTSFEIQPFPVALHQPQIHRLGGLVFKGQDAKELFYREIRQGNLRFGYRQVPSAWELQFDSATNFASLQKPLQ
jgi:hypothetical protein